jgi:hypothetical protein
VKTIHDYGIGCNNATVIAHIPAYLLNSQGLLKYLKVSGYW